MNRLSGLTFVCVTLVTVAAARAGGRGGESFDITMHRPTAVGQKMHVRGDGILDREVTAVIRGTEQSPQKSTVKITFDAESEVLEVDRKGRPVRVAYNVRECVARQDGISSVIATPGATLIATRNGRATTFAVNGRPVGPAANEALQLLANLDAGDATEDEIAGTTRPRTIGESWPINVNATVRELQRQSDQRLRAGDFSGTTTLVDVTEHRGEPCLMLYTQMSTRNTVPGLTDLPAGFTVRDGSMAASTHRLYPLDEKMPMVSDFRRMEVLATLTASGSTAQPISQMQFKMVQMVEMETTPIDARAAGRDFERASQATQD